MEHLVKSNTLAELAQALIKAKANFDPVLKDTKNPLYNSKYADLSGIIGATEKHLFAEGLVILQFPEGTENTTGVTTLLLHRSGEFVHGTLLLPASMPGKKDKDGNVGVRLDAQTACSAITFARRYGYKSILGISEEDDDGNKVVNGDSGVSTPRSAKPATTKKVSDAPKPASGPTKAVIPDPPQASKPSEAPPQPTPQESGANGQEMRVSASPLPTKVELSIYYTKAKEVSAALGKAGLEDAGPKLVKFIVKKAGVEAMPAISKAKWDAIINKLEELVKSDVQKLITIIKEAI